jgi:phospholipase/carboxylesterase
MAVNRIKLSTSSIISTATRSPAADLSAGSTSSESTHSIFVPIHYERNYAYPLVVWLHGEGANQQQLQQIMPLVSVRNYIAVGPRGTVVGANGNPGYGWWQSERDIKRAEAAVLDSVDAVQQRHSIASNRVFIAGFSDGGTMAVRLGLQHPDVFAGAATIGGAFPQKHCPLKNLLQSRHLPIFIAHGRDADDYPVEQTCDDLRLLHAGGFSVTLRQYPCSQELTTQMLSDMNSWIMEQVTGQSADAARKPSPPPSELN